MVRRGDSDEHEAGVDGDVGGYDGFWDPRTERDGFGTHWSEGLKNRKATQPKFGFNELRWGAKVDQTLVIPAASVAPISLPFVQIIQVTEPQSRVWTLDIALEWVNTIGAPADTVTAAFVIQTGVGSGQVNRFTTLTANTVVSVGALIIPNLPAATIYVSVSLRITPIAGAARSYLGRLAAMCAPIFR